MPILLKDTFKAWIDNMPGAPPTLIAIGDVQVPTSGWHVWLAKRPSQGINPNVLILDVNAQKPSGIVLEVITKIPLRYVESPPQHEYTQVTIIDGKDGVTVGVGSTQ
jgi:hypothetical protein